MRRRAQNRAEIERAKLRGGRAAQAQHPRGVRTVRRKTNADRHVEYRKLDAVDQVLPSDQGSSHGTAAAGNDRRPR